MSAWRYVEDLLTGDPGRRGVKPLATPGDLQAAAISLLEAQRVAIVTGFFIPSAGVCETDGPPGAWALGHALATLGVEAVYVTDAACAPPIRRAGPTPLVVSDGHHVADLGDITHLVSIERVGRADDGRYYTMRGNDISDHTAPLDRLFLERPASVTHTIGIGDGGNEIGMGRVHEQVRRHIEHGAKIACVVATDFLIAAGVSHWGAWGLIAGLSIVSGTNLLPSAATARADLERLVAAGAVDGVTSRAEPTIDGIEWPIHRDILRRLDQVVSDALNGPEG